jgi:alkylhydroperoxidase/carboxymuconolactone decarboxylase family protein YurZ
MKRRPELRSLSVEHRDGLIVARHLRRAAAGEEPLDAAVTGLARAWREEIGPHFAVEEAVLLPAFAHVAGEGQEFVSRVLSDHVALRGEIARLEQASGEAERQRLAGEVGRALEAHIRFEERVLFPAIEAALSQEALATLGAQLDAAPRGMKGCAMPERAKSVEPPDVVKEFAAAHPEVWEAYNRLGEVTAAGPLDERTQRLTKLALAIGAQRQGAVNSHTRRALAAGCTPEELVHVGILAIPTLGWPAAFAAICWIQETIRKQRG